MVSKLTFQKFSAVIALNLIQGDIAKKIPVLKVGSEHAHKRLMEGQFFHHVDMMDKPWSSVVIPDWVKILAYAIESELLDFKCCIVKYVQ